MRSGVLPVLFAAVALFDVLFLALPTLVVLAASFTAGTIVTFPPDGWSLRWYAALLQKPEFVAALLRSLQVGLVATALAVPVGTLAALGLARPRSATIASLLLAIAAGAVAWAAWIDLTTWSAAGLDPTASGQGATVFGLMSWQATFAAISVIMGGYALLRRMFGLIDPARPATCELIGLFLAFTAGQGAFVLLLTRLFPGS